MSEPTKQQLEAAAKAAVEAADWGMTYIQSDALRRALTAAAPHLQLPWELPSYNELRVALESTLDIPAQQDALAAALRQFVANRNASPILPPPDPKLEKIVDILNNKEHVSPADKALAILALDGEE